MEKCVIFSFLRQLVQSTKFLRHNVSMNRQIKHICLNKPRCSWFNIPKIYSLEKRKVKKKKETLSIIKFIYSYTILFLFEIKNYYLIMLFMTQILDIGWSIPYVIQQVSCLLWLWFNKNYIIKLINSKQRTTNVRKEDLINN